MDVAYRQEFISMYEYLMARFKENEAKLFSVVSSEGTRNNGHKLKQDIPFKSKGANKCSED